jgi:hypothetical protein
MESCTASLFTSCLCCLTINVYKYSCTRLVCALLITSATISVCECRHYTASACTSLYLTAINFSAGGICILCSHLTWTFRCTKEILHERLALFIQLFISEVILRITNCLFFKSKYNITHTFYNLCLYRTINKYSHVKYSYCFVPVIHADINVRILSMWVFLFHKLFQLV